MRCDEVVTNHHKNAHFSHYTAIFWHYDLNGVQEASSSNLDTRTKRGLLSNPLFILYKYNEYNLVLFFENLVLSFENNA